MRRSLLTLGGLAGWLWVAAQPVVAQPAGARPARSASIKAVLLVERGKPRARTALVTALRAQLSRRGVQLDVLGVRRFAAKLPVQLAMARRAAALRSARVVVWFSLSRSMPLFVYFAEGKQGRLVMRSFGDLEADERAEAAAIVVRSAVGAYERGEQPGTDVAALPRTLKMTHVPAARRKPGGLSRRLSLELGYGYAYDDWDAAVTGLHNVQLQLALQLHPRWSLFAGYQWTGPVMLRDPANNAEVQLRPHRWALGARLLFPLGKRWELGASLSVAAELVDYVVREQPLVTDLDVRPLMLFSLVPCLHAGVRLFERLRLVVELGLEVELRTPTLQLEMPAEPPATTTRFSKLGRPEVVRPRLLLALVVDLF